MLGCKIGTCEVVNEYVKAGRVICEGRMVLYADRTSIAWSAQGLKVSVDFRFGGPLPVIGTKEATPDMTRIQTMFVLCTLAPETIVSAVIQEEENCKGDCGAELNQILAGGPKLIYYNK